MRHPVDSTHLHPKMHARTHPQFCQVLAPRDALFAPGREPVLSLNPKSRRNWEKWVYPKIWWPLKTQKKIPIISGISILSSCEGFFENLNFKNFHILHFIILHQNKNEYTNLRDSESYSKCRQILERKLCLSSLLLIQADMCKSKLFFYIKK